MRKEKCDFCGEPAEWDGPTHVGPWAYACKSCTHRLTGAKRRLPRQGNENKGKQAKVPAYMQNMDDAVAECPCGHNQPVEADAEFGYCMECGMKLTFTSPIESLFQEGYDNE